jgi:hypothetical protein
MQSWSIISMELTNSLTQIAIKPNISTQLSLVINLCMRQLNGFVLKALVSKTKQFELSCTTLLTKAQLSVIYEPEATDLSRLRESRFGRSDGRT